MKHPVNVIVQGEITGLFFRKHSVPPGLPRRLVRILDITDIGAFPPCINARSPRNRSPDTSHPAPHSSAVALASVVTTGIPQVCASIRGSPKPSANEHKDKNIQCPLYQVTMFSSVIKSHVRNNNYPGNSICLPDSQSCRQCSDIFNPPPRQE